MVERDLPVDYLEFMEHYDQLPERSFDYEVLEHTRRAVVIPILGCGRILAAGMHLFPICKEE